MKYLIHIFLVVLHLQVYCQTNATVFRPISLDQGHINDIMRDKEGFIWISTQDGLTKYNGSDFIQYNFDRRDTNSIAHNYVWKTFEDSHENLWIGLFGGGLCRFDKKENRFTRYDKFLTIADHGVRTFGQLNDSTLIVGTDYGLHLFDLHGDTFRKTPNFLKKQFEAGLFHTHSLEIYDNQIIVAGENGGYILNPAKTSVQKIELNELAIARIGFIKKLNNGSLLVSGLNKVIITHYNGSTQTLKLINEITLPDELTINDAAEDKNGTILITAEEGLFKLNFSEKTVTPIRNDIPKINNLTDKVAYCIASIENDLNWIGTKTHIYEYSEKNKVFHHIHKDSLCGSAILGMSEDADGNLWVCTRRGLGRIKNFDQPRDRWEYLCYDKSTNPEINNEYILNIKQLGNNLLVGFRKKGFSILEIRGNDNIYFQKPPLQLDKITRDGSVSNFMQDNKNTIWISTSGNGVVSWTPNDNNRVQQYINRDGETQVLSHNYTFGFEEIDNNWIAVATAAGISMIHRTIDSTYQIVKGPDSIDLSGNFIMDFHRDKDNKLWVCTDGGINLWEKNNQFKSITKNDGLPNEVIYGMLEHNDELWISSNKGLVRIDNTPSNNLKVFSKEDDVMNEEHNQFSYYKSKKGDLLFGGKVGITLFNPEHITPNTISSTPIIESFKLFNKSGDEKLSQHINYTNKISLNHNENFLSFDLASLSYVKSNQNKYRYRLNPLNNDWIDMGRRNFISLNGLAPGSYELKIQASNNDGVWGDDIKSVLIEIKNPIYARWYAWLLYLIIVGSIIYAFYRMKINHITNLSLAREEERTKIRERSARDFHDEVGSLVTKLSLLNQYVLTNIQPEEKENIGILNKMQSNIQRIRTGMKDFIWVLDPSKDSLDSALIKLKEIGNDIFEHSGIKFQCKISTSVERNLQLNGVQRRQLILLVKEALNNVIKHSKASLCVITVDQSAGSLNITITDDGEGFDLNAYEAGYGLKSMNERARKMKGGVVTESEINIGTKTKVTVPTHPNGL